MIMMNTTLLIYGVIKLSQALTKKMLYFCNERSYLNIHMTYIFENFHFRRHINGYTFLNCFKDTRQCSCNLIFSENKYDDISKKK